MSTKTFIIAAMWAVATLLFFLVGLTIEDGRPDYDFIGLGLGLTVLGFLVDKVWNPAE
jgi:uncharacterized RDD family membrane protein YckC